MRILGVVSFFVILSLSCQSTVEVPESAPPLVLVKYDIPQMPPEQVESIKTKLSSLYPEGEVIHKTEDGFFSPSIDALVEEGSAAMPFIVEEYNSLFASGRNITKRHLLVEVARRIASRAHLGFVCWVLVKGDKTEKVTAAKALLEFGNNSCVPALISALDDIDREVIWRSGAALHRITGADFGLRPEINDEDFKTAIYRWKLWYRDCYLRTSYGK